MLTLRFGTFANLIKFVHMRFVGVWICLARMCSLVNIRTCRFIGHCRLADGDISIHRDMDIYTTRRGIHMCSYIYICVCVGDIYIYV